MSKRHRVTRRSWSESYRRRPLGFQRLESRFALSGTAQDEPFDESAIPPALVEGPVLSAEFSNPGIVAINDALRGIVIHRSNDPYSRIKAQIVDSLGTPLTGIFPVSELTAGADSRYRVAMDAGGNFVVVWWNTNGLYARLFTADGTPRGPNFQVTSSNPLTEFDVAMQSNGDFVVTWQEFDFDPNYHPGFETRVKMYDALGNANGEDFGVSPIADTRITRPRIAMDADGDFVVVYYQASVDGRPSGAVFQRFNQNGQRVGQPVFVSSDVYLATAEEPFAVAMAPAGQFVIAWRRFRAGTQGTEIVAARYDANGILQNSIFAVSEKINVKDPKVRSDADGDFVVSWGRYFGPSDPTGYLRLEYYARRYFADGRPQTGEFRSGGSLVSSLSNGDFLVSSFPNARWYRIALNAPPVNNDDLYSVNQNANLIAPRVTANDTDADGVIPPDETYVDRLPDHGTLLFNDDGTFRYIPDRDFAGVDSFTYHVNGDNGLMSNVATVTINVNAIAGRSTFSATNILPYGAGLAPITGWARFNPADPNGGPYHPTYTVNRAGISVTPDGTLNFGNGGWGPDGTFTVTLNDGQGALTYRHSRFITGRLRVGPWSFKTRPLTEICWW